MRRRRGAREVLDHYPVERIGERVAA